MKPWAVKTTWTPELIGQLQRLAGEGLSCNEIRVALGNGISRSAVIGKLHRLGIEKKPKQEKPQRTPKPRPDYRQRKAGLRPTPPVILPNLPEPEGTMRAHMLDLGPHDCRWPCGDPQDADFGFCGRMKVEGEVYCADHCARAYTGFSAGHAGMQRWRTHKVRTDTTPETEPDVDLTTPEREAA